MLTILRAPVINVSQTVLDLLQQFRLTLEKPAYHHRSQIAATLDYTSAKLGCSSVTLAVNALA